MEYDRIEISPKCRHRIVNRSDCDLMDREGVLQLGVCDAEEAFTVGRRSPNCHMAIFTFGDSGQLILEDNELLLSPGSLVLVPLETANEIRIEKQSWQLAWVMIESSRTWNKLFDQVALLDFSEGDVFRNYIEGIFLSYATEDPMIRSLVDGQVKGCLHLLKQCMLTRELSQRSQESSNFRRLDRLFNEVGQQLHKTWTIQELAEKAHWSTAHFHRLCVKYYSQGPQQKLIAMRMNKAGKLLRDTDIPIQHVAELVGYSDLANFSSRFKKFWSINPRKYRNTED